MLLSCNKILLGTRRMRRKLRMTERNFLPWGKCFRSSIVMTIPVLAVYWRYVQLKSVAFPQNWLRKQWKDAYLNNCCSYLETYSWSPSMSAVVTFPCFSNIASIWILLHMNLRTLPKLPFDGIYLVKVNY